MSAGKPTVLRFDASCVEIDVRVATWEDAVLEAGRLLAAHGFATADYGPHMVDVIERFGPYVVIAPGIALVHARPGRDTIANGLVALTLAEPVHFGHAHYDPVRLVMGVAVTRAEDHLSVVASIANAIDGGGVLERAMKLRNPQDFVDRFVARHDDLEVVSSEAEAAS